jgi:hypothetical protein
MPIALKRSYATKVLGALLLPVLAFGCASAPSSPPVQPESLLRAAGFKVVAATTDRQLQLLPRLPPGQVTVVTQTGKNFFVYPDATKNQVYVGTEKEYQAYLKLRAQNNMPVANPEASYFQQDAAMRKADTRDASVPWDLWPDFNGLGW